MNTKLLTSILQSSNDLITSEDFLTRHRIGNAFTRSGKLSFSNLIYFVLQSVHKSIPINYARFLENFPSDLPIFVSKQAISKARQGISHKAFLELFRLSVKQFYFQPVNLRTWNGFHIYAVDGSTIQIPESKENYEVFGGNPNKTKIISPLASASVLYDVINDILIDVSLHPYTSSSTTIAAYGPIGAGIPGVQPDHVVGVLKAYSTCVGAGPFVAENAMPEEWKESLRKAGGEYGAATGRPRRVGPFDAVASRYGLKCQRADKIALTKLDVLSYMQEIPIITGYLYKGKETDTFVPTENLEEYQPVISFIPGWKQDISACRRWEELPDAAKNYIKTLEKLLDHEIQFISVGAKREEYLIKGEWL